MYETLKAHSPFCICIVISFDKDCRGLDIPLVFRLKNIKLLLRSRNFVEISSGKPSDNFRIFTSSKVAIGL